MDAKFKTRVDHFLAQQNIAVAGYSSTGKETANHLYGKFKKHGYNVIAVNPKSDKVTDVECYPDLKSIPQKPDGLIISTPSSATLGLIQECIALGIKNEFINAKRFNTTRYISINMEDSKDYENVKKLIDLKLKN